MKFQSSIDGSPVPLHSFTDLMVKPFCTISVRHCQRASWTSLRRFFHTRPGALRTRSGLLMDSPPGWWGFHIKPVRAVQESLHSRPIPSISPCGLLLGKAPMLLPVIHMQGSASDFVGHAKASD